MALVDVIIGYAKGAQGDVGPQGPQGEIGPQGPQGPLPPLVNNALTTTAGVAALDAAMGKTLQDQVTTTNSNLIKCYIGEQATTSLAPENDGMITLAAVGPGTVKAIIPLGYSPSSHWQSEIIFKGTNIASNAISFRVAQRVSGATAQAFTIRYLVLYI